jgi:hypothetical protein
MARQPAATRAKWVRLPSASLIASCRFRLHLKNVPSEPILRWRVFNPTARREYIITVNDEDRVRIPACRKACGVMAARNILSANLRWVFPVLFRGGGAGRFLGVAQWESTALGTPGPWVRVPLPRLEPATVPPLSWWCNGKHWTLRRSRSGFESRPGYCLFCPRSVADRTQLCEG